MTTALNPPEALDLLKSRTGLPLYPTQAIFVRSFSVIEVATAAKPMSIGTHLLIDGVLVILLGGFVLFARSRAKKKED